MGGILPLIFYMCTLLLGLVVSVTTMADVVELRVGSDLAHNGKFKGGQYSGSNVKLKKKSTRNGFELAGEYRKSLTDTWELGGGIAYRFNRISEEGTEKKGLHQVPLYHYEIGRASVGKECRSRWSQYH